MRTWDQIHTIPCGNGFKVSWTRRFFIFLPTFCHIWWFFKEEHTESTIHMKIWKIINYGKNLQKNKEMPCSTWLKHISPKYSRYLKIGLQLPDPLLASKNYLIFFQVLRGNMAGAHLILLTRGSPDTLSISDEQTIEDYVKYYHLKVSSILIPESEKLPLGIIFQY